MWRNLPLALTVGHLGRAGARVPVRAPQGERCLVLRHYELAHLLSNIEKLHFPFWAVCSFSGTQPEFSLGRLHPHVEKDTLSLFVASSQFSVLRA